MLMVTRNPPSLLSLAKILFRKPVESSGVGMIAFFFPPQTGPWNPWLFVQRKKFLVGRSLPNRSFRGLGGQWFVVTNKKPGRRRHDVFCSMLMTFWWLWQKCEVTCCSSSNLLAQENLFSSHEMNQHLCHCMAGLELDSVNPSWAYFYYAVFKQLGEEGKRCVDRWLIEWSAARRSFHQGPVTVMTWNVTTLYFSVKFGAHRGKGHSRSQDSISSWNQSSFSFTSFNGTSKPHFEGANLFRIKNLPEIFKTRKDVVVQVTFKAGDHINIQAKRHQIWNLVAGKPGVKLVSSGGG